MHLHDRIQQKLSEKDLKQADIARSTGVSTAAVTKWLNGDNVPKSANLQSIARLLGVSAQWLLTGKADPAHVIPPILDDGLPNRTIPVLSMVQAGHWTPVMASDLSETTEYLPWIKEVGNNGFSVIVGGYSMSPYFLPNDRLYVNPDMEASNEDLVIAMCNDDSEATFKQLIVEAGQKYLMPLNKDWVGSKIIQLDETCSIKGVVVSSIRSIDKRMFRSAHS